MHVVVQPLTIADLAVLANVAAEVFDDPIDEAAARAFLSDPNHFLVVARDEEKHGLVIGFASAVRMFHPDKEKPELFVNEVGVAPEYQRRGVGKALMKTLLDEAKKAGCRGAWVSLDEDNEAALALYKAAGGKTPERQIHIDFDFD